MNSRDELRNNFFRLKEVVNGIEMDVMRVYDKNISATVRVRKAMKEVSDLAKSLRLLSSEIRGEVKEEKKKQTNV